MPDLSQQITSQIPSHIIENHPRFIDFLKAYYEWLSADQNPFGHLKNHMDYLSFEKSLDSYTDMMKREYLSDVPDEVLLDKELFIKWSKKFNLARGSHQSYSFLFKLLFDEDGVSIYLPKENILKTSDGEWIQGESRMLLANTANISDFSFQVLTQEKDIGAGEIEFSYATIQDAKKVKYGKYDLIELTVSDIDGDFSFAQPVYTELGGESWIVKTIGSINIIDEGTNYLPGDKVELGNIGGYLVEGIILSETFDTKVTTKFIKDEISVYLNSIEIFDYTYDGRYISVVGALDGDIVEVAMPSYKGYCNINDIDENGSVVSINMVEPVISTDEDYMLYGASYGRDFVATGLSSPTTSINGYFVDNKGQLSSNMYLQDSFFYQNYSYAIQTIQDISKYSNTVKELLHPAGFEYFGIMNIVSVVEMILELVEGDSPTVLPTKMESSVRYSLGPNYSFFDRFKHGWSSRLYKLYHFRGISDLEFVYVEEDYLINTGSYVDTIKRSDGFYYDHKQIDTVEYFYMDQNYIENLEDYIDSEIYKLYDKSLEKTFDNGNYEKYNETRTNVSFPMDGWMTKHNYVDYHLYVPQDYSLEVESGNSYFETGYVS